MDWRPRHGAYWLAILPAVAMLAILYLVPLADVLVNSVTDPKPGLDNYTLLFTSTCQLDGLGIIDEPLPLMRKETGVLIVMVHVMPPYAVLTLYPNMRGIDVRLVAAELLGGGKVLMVAEYVAVQLNDTLRWGLGTMLAATLMLSVLAALWALPRVVDVKRLFGA